MFALFACATARAGDVVAPAHPLDDPAAVKAAFAARIGHPVHVLTFGFGEHYADAIVQNDAAPDEFDRYEMAPGQTNSALVIKKIPGKGLRGYCNSDCCASRLQP